jgi:EAL domain-containing protein (putative c-di-GMP-specific phosphodiesterase class I)
VCSSDLLPAVYGHAPEAAASGLPEAQIDLHFQPIVDLKSGRFRKAEGLARWRHPERGFIPPGQFIPLAEETGLIHPLGQLALDRALKARRRLLEAGLDCEIGVNISARQMDAQGFAQALRAALDREDMARSPLVIEVTESLLLGDFEKGRAILQDLAGAGATIALDDFGTGYSSLSYLAQLPVNVLKIDASFVKHVDSRAEVARLVRAIIDLGHDLGLQIVAEGVETEAQRACLLAMGCDFGQGFLFAKAMPIDELIEHLRAAKAAGSAASAESKLYRG